MTQPRTYSLTNRPTNQLTRPTDTTQAMATASGKHKSIENRFQPLKQIKNWHRNSVKTFVKIFVVASVNLHKKYYVLVFWGCHFLTTTKINQVFTDGCADQNNDTKLFWCNFLTQLSLCIVSRATSRSTGQASNGTDRHRPTNNTNRETIRFG